LFVGVVTNKLIKWLSDNVAEVKIGGLQQSLFNALFSLHKETNKTNLRTVGNISQ